MTSRACELLPTDADHREYHRRRRAVAALENRWSIRSQNPLEFHAYLVALADRIERLYQWVDEMWLYGPGGSAQFDSEIEQEDVAEPSTLNEKQISRRRNRARWRQASQLADRLSREARQRGEVAEAGRLERSFFRTIWPFLPVELQNKEVALDRAAVTTMLRGDLPRRLLAVSLDSLDVRLCGRLPVILCDDPLEFEPATATCRRIGLFAEPLRSFSGPMSRLKPYPRIEVAEGSGS